MRQAIVVYVRASVEDKGPGPHVRLDMSVCGDNRKDSDPPIKEGDQEGGPNGHASIVMPGRLDQLDERFITLLTRDIRDCAESRMKRALHD
jgi:hypothetical protein